MNPIFFTDKVLLGAAYYHEYHRSPRLEEDFEAMKDAHLSVIRVGESVWSTWEPEDDQFNLDWLQPILDMAGKSEIKVIIGTPTYAIPHWLRIKHPTLIAERATGHPIPFGHRQNVDYSQDLFIHYANRVVEKIVTRYTDHPAVMGWQVDNEPGVEIFHNVGAFEAFKEFLKDKFETVEHLNNVWGLTYWSHRMNSWDELWLPDGNTNAGYHIEWRRFQSLITERFISQQASLVRSLALPNQWITTCIAPVRPAQDIYTVAKNLDISAVNIYYAAQDGLAYPQTPELKKQEIPAAFFIDTSGPSSVFRQADIAYSIKQDNFLVPETNASFTMHANQAGIFPTFPGQLQQVALALISRGASMIEYWHWHTLHYGAESYWGGILGHNYERGRTYNSVSTIGSLLEKSGSQILNLTPISQAAMVYSPESKWALEFFSPLRKPVDNRHGADINSYERIFNAFYDALFDAEISVNIISPDLLSGDIKTFVDKYPILVLPALYIADDKALIFANKYADAGGHLITTPRTGYAQLDASIRSERAPAVIGASAGLYYDEFTNLTKDILVTGPEFSGKAIGWADLIVSQGAQPLAFYNDPFLQNYPALLTKECGKGRITTIGTIPDPELGKSLGMWIKRLHNLIAPVTSNSPSVRSNKARNSADELLTFIFNWSWENVECQSATNLIDLETGAECAKGSKISLAPWSVKIFRDI